MTENWAKEVGISIYTQFKHRITMIQLVDSALYSETGKGCGNNACSCDPWKIWGPRDFDE